MIVWSLNGWHFVIVKEIPTKVDIIKAKRFTKMKFS